MQRRNGFTLVEVMLVVVLLAMAAVGAEMLAPISATRSIQAATESQKLMAALRMSRQTALASQTTVRLRLLGSPRLVTGYVVEQQSGGRFIPLMPEEIISGLPVMTSNANSILFSPTGSADVSLVVNLGTGRQNHQVSVVAGTGLVRYVKR